MAEPAFDLVLRNGNLLDPANNVRGRLDVGIRDGTIVALEPTLEAIGAGRVVDLGGKLVTPGLIDLHTHVYPGGMPGALEPDLAGVQAGVTTVVDAGSAGPHTFEGFVQLGLRDARTRIIPFLNVARSGLAFRPEIRAAEDIDVAAVLATVERHRGLIGGLKLRAIGPAIPLMGLDLFRRAKEAAREARLPLMVHIGETESPDSESLTPGLLPLLEPGDILTHVYTPHPGGIFDAGGNVLRQATDAYAAGVVFDIGHGVRNFGFNVARTLLDVGILPHTLSTDMAVRPRNGPARSLVETMAKFLALGLSLDDVVVRATSIPARVIGLSDVLRGLMVGAIADLTVVDLVEGRFRFCDSIGGTFEGTRALRPVLTIKDGRLETLDWGPHPWGWLPEGIDG